MTGLARALMCVLCLGAGWLSCMWWNGLLVRSDVASAEKQAAGEQFILADRAIGSASDSLGATRERVRTVIKEVPTHVSSSCPPGVGLVSDSAAERLRAALAEAAAATAKPAAHLRPTGH